MIHTATRTLPLAGLRIIMALIVVAFVTSCGNPKKIIYFRDLPDSLGQIKSVQPVDYVEPVLHVGDILNITIQTIDQKSTEMLAGQGSPAAGAVSGYVIDNNGFIEIPMVGRLKVEGKTIDQTKEMLREAARQYYKDPVVNVRLANGQITVLGEVTKPGTVILPKDKIGLVDAIGLAGDLSPYGKRDNILLIREENGQKVFVRLDMNSTDVYKSPYYYIRSGDVIYVEPNDLKARNATVDYTRERYFAYLITIINLTFTILNYVNFQNNR